MPDTHQGVQALPGWRDIGMSSDLGYNTGGNGWAGRKSFGKQRGDAEVVAGLLAEAG